MSQNHTYPEEDTDPRRLAETKTDNRRVADESSASRTADTDEAATRGVSVVVPTYNERENIVPLVRACRQALAEYDGEVIVVDDDSPDGTWRLVGRTFNATDDVRVIRRTEDKGLAKAVVDGFQASRYDDFAVIDADFQHPPERLPDLVDALRESDAQVAVGSRYLDPSGIEGWSYRRKAISFSATTVTQAVHPKAGDISDPLSGFFAVERELLEDASLSPTGYKILLEVLTECDVDQAVEVPFTFSDRNNGESKATVEEYAKFLNHLASCSYRARVDNGDSVAREIPLSTLLKR